MNTQNAIAPDSTQKRENILAQAIQTFADEGFQKADVQVIADRAGVGKGTVYRYFGSKQDLFWACTYDVLDRLAEHLLAAIEGVGGSLERLRAAGRAYAGFFETNPQYLEVFVQDRAEFRGAAPEALVEYHKRLIRRFGDVVERGIADGELRPVHVRKTVVSLGSVLYGSVVNASYAGIDYSLAELAQHAVDIFLEGIRAHSPRGEQGASQ